MERVCLSFETVRGTGEEFDRRHQEAWPEFLDALGRSGFTTYTLFRRGSTVIAYGECEPTVAEAFAKLSSEPVSKRWGEWFTPEILPVAVIDSDGVPDRVDEVWHFEP
jgi:L-rhamnose mutarotase